MHTALEKDSTLKQFHIIGWREWICFPELKVDKLKAKIDTGARTSALHAFQMDVFKQNNIEMIDFSIHPIQYSTGKVIRCRTHLHDMRWITDSSGHKELRPSIKTTIMLGSLIWPIEITLTNRDDMRFRFLLGRAGIPKHFLVSTSSSYLIGKKR